MDQPGVAPTSDLAKPSLPRSFGSYELLEEVARGGMGIVYRARPTDLNRLVAVKVLTAGPFAAPELIKRFRTEADVLAKLDHPNIVPIHEVGECEGQAFFSMKFVAGGSLAQRVANAPSPFSNRDAARLVVKLARAVHYAHQHGILHRDIKPGNVLVDSNGEPHLTDFGLARLVEQDSTLTRTMAMLGTPSYMSPEQARGESKQLTTATDVYGLGAVLYELLAGRPPFVGGTTMETVRHVLDQEPARPSSIQPGADRDLETICLKCLEKEASRRYGSAEALAEDLERWLQHEPILARPVSGAERVVKWMSRNPVVTFFAAITILVIATSVIMLARANVRIRKAQATESTLRGLAEHKAEESRQQLVRLNVRTGNGLMEDGDYFRALLWFTEALRLENGVSDREDVHRRRLGAVLRQAPELAQVWFHGGIVQNVGFNPGGDRVFSTGSTRDVHIWDVAKPTPAVPALQHDHEATETKFSPDGKRILTLDSHGMARLWDAATGAHLKPADPALERSRFSTIDFSPDGRWMALAGARGVQLFDADGGAPGPLLASANGAAICRFAPSGRLLGAAQKREVRLWTEASDQWSQKTLKHPSDVWGIAFSPDQKRVATRTQRQLFVWDSATGEMLRSIDSAGTPFDCEFSRDGRWLVLASWAPNVRLFGTEDLHERSWSVRHRTGVACSRFANDSKWLATCSWDFTARVWKPGTGEAASPLLTHGGYVLALDFSPDSSRLVTAGQDQTVRLWDLRANNGALLEVRHERAVKSVQFSPDGERLFTWSRDRRACLWDAHTGRLLVSTPRHGQEIAAGALGPDGTTMVTACADGVRLWDAQTGEQIGATLGGNKNLDWVSYSPDGRRISSASSAGNVFIWNVADQRLVAEMSSQKGLLHLRFSVDGRRVLTAGTDGTARVWDVASGQPIGQPMKHDGTVADVNFSPDGRRVVTACTDRSQGSRAAQMWDATTGERIGPEMPHQDGVVGASFSPDGKFIATGGEDRMAIVWDAATGRRLTPGMLHPSYAAKVEFSPDGQLLLTLGDTGSGGGFARVWEAATGEPVTPPLLHSGNVTHAAWSPDGKRIALAAEDGTASIWDVSGAAGSVDLLRQHAEILSAHRLEPGHGLLPLTAKEMQARWAAVKTGSLRY